MHCYAKVTGVHVTTTSGKSKLVRLELEGHALPAGSLSRHQRQRQVSGRPDRCRIKRTRSSKPRAHWSRLTAATSTRRGTARTQRSKRCPVNRSLQSRQHPVLPCAVYCLADCWVSRNGWIASSGLALLISFSEQISIASSKRVFMELGQHWQSRGTFRGIQA
jgi:hypothetical protein